MVQYLFVNAVCLGAAHRDSSLHSRKSSRRVGVVYVASCQVKMEAPTSDTQELGKYTTCKVNRKKLENVGPDHVPGECL